MLADHGQGTHFAFEEVLPPEVPRTEKSLEICRDFQHGKCELGDRCPKRHVISNFRTAIAKVCQHWLRGACANGENCPYLHEYDDRFVPTCVFFERQGECTNPECPFTHQRPDESKAECAAYKRGFCGLGPHCPLRHVQYPSCCPYYLAGFCPLGPRCPLGHPVQELHNFATVQTEVRQQMILERSDDPTFNPNPTCFTCFDPGHIATNCPGLQHGRVHKHLSQVHEPKEAPPAAPDADTRHYGKRVCFLCHEEGHNVRDCPKLPPVQRQRRA